jgi:hypothetical protein
VALPAASIAQICKSLSQYLGTKLNEGGGSTVDVRIGTPADAAPGDSDTDHRCNLFFFRFEPSGFAPDSLPGDTWFLRTHCLVTPFAAAEGTTTSAGENDLRLIGEVLRVFHEKPVFELTAAGELFHVQVVFQNLGLDQLNQLWSTQGETVYRPSALFEVSLVPVIPSDPTVAGPLAGSLGLDVRADMNAVSSGIVASTPRVLAGQPDTARESWAPSICLVRSGQCEQSVSLQLGSPELAAFSPQVWVVGEIGAGVQLRWDAWDAVHGWQSLPGTAAATISEDILDPEAVAAATLATVALPFDDKAGQMVLYAERSYTRGSDGVVLTVRSNPVLISLHGAAP